MRTRCRGLAWLLVVLATGGAQARAQEEEEGAPSFGARAEVESPKESASSEELDGEALRLRPYQSAGDLMSGITGMFVAQHAGGGKAQQYFLRGFDADHGSDVAFFVDGVPVNWVSHGHGQGYTELHWIIPELVERVEVRKGPYFADLGDLATAGAVSFVLHDDLEHSSFTLGGGRFHTWRALAILAPETDHGPRPLLAAEGFGTDGPFENEQDLRRLNLFGRLSDDLPNGGQYTITATGHLSDWNASGQIPLRAVRAGDLDRFGSIDPHEGGLTHRHGGYASVRTPAGDDGEVELLAWLYHYRFALYSNFTFFLEDPVQGDMIRQGDRRTYTGLKGSYSVRHRTGELGLATHAGLQLRYDHIRNTLDRAPQRQRVEARVAARVNQARVGVYAEERISWSRYVRGTVGLRGDVFTFDVEDQLAGAPDGSGDRVAAIVSPKASLAVMPLPELTLFANVGTGFHSNDARGVVLGEGGVSPLTRAFGYETGAQTSLWEERLRARATFFVLDLDSEIVWVGDEGTTEPRGETRRLGVEIAADARLTDWLTADMSTTWVRATFVDNPANANAVALAPTFLLDGGLSVRHPVGLVARVGLRHLADRPATEDRFFEASGFTLLDVTAGYEHDRFAVRLWVSNVWGADWRVAQFASVSRLPGEDSAADCPPGTRPAESGGAFAGCEDIHFTPGPPIDVRLEATVHF
ncbi:MAG: TonB-dependent receptor [Myxococcota bacterium]